MKTLYVSLEGMAKDKNVWPEVEHYMFITGCRYFFKTAGNLFDSRYGFFFR